MRFSKGAPDHKVWTSYNQQKVTCFLSHQTFKNEVFLDPLGHLVLRRTLGPHAPPPRGPSLARYASLRCNRLPTPSLEVTPIKKATMSAMMSKKEKMYSCFTCKKGKNRERQIFIREDEESATEEKRVRRGKKEDMTKTKSNLIYLAREQWKWCAELAIVAEWQSLPLSMRGMD